MLSFGGKWLARISPIKVLITTCPSFPSLLHVSEPLSPRKCSMSRNPKNSSKFIVSCVSSTPSQSRRYSIYASISSLSMPARPQSVLLLLRICPQSSSPSGRPAGLEKPAPNIITLYFFSAIKCYFPWQYEGQVII